MEVENGLFQEGNFQIARATNGLTADKYRSRARSLHFGRRGRLVDVTKNIYASMASKFHVEPTFTGYGKSGVRLLKIKRSEKYHDIKQIEVATELKLANYHDYMTGNNASVIPTDTQKNTVYALAKDHPVGRSLYFC